jgi:hypothetical protein
MSERVGRDCACGFRHTCASNNGHYVYILLRSPSRTHPKRVSDVCPAASLERPCVEHAQTGDARHAASRYGA